MKKTLLSLFAIIVIATTVHAQIPTNGLVAYYPFTGNANDASGNGNNGTVNGATLNTDRFGRANSAYSFNGQWDLISADGSKMPIANSSRAIAGWFNINNIVSSQGEDTLISYGDYGFGIYSKGYLLHYPGTHYCIANNKNPLDGNWHFFVLQHDSIKNQSYIYFDGKLSCSYTEGLSSYYSYLIIGKCKGSIDDIRIYNRILDSTEVQSLYHEGGYANSATYISSFNPTTAGTGTTVSIKGTSFTGASAVSFGGTAASSFKVVNDSTITAIVGNGASGNVKVVAPNGTDSLKGFVFSTSTIPMNGLVAWYPFTGNTLDSSGNNNHGTNNGATLTTDRFGKANSAYSFNGTKKNYISAQVTGIPLASNPRTVNFWAKWSGASYVNSAMVINYGTKAPLQAFGCMIFSGNNWFMYNDANDLNSNKIADTSWVMVTLTYANKNRRIFINGVLINQDNMSLNTISNLLVIGTNLFIPKNTVDDYFSGKIDDIAVYNRVLDTTEIKSLYHEGGYANSVTYISSFNPTTAGTGTTVSIKGNSFTGASAVSFGGTAASSFKVVNDSTITAIVNNGASGYVKVVTPNGTDSLKGFVYSATNPFVGVYTLVKNRIHFQASGKDYYDSIVANLGYLNLSNNGIAYLKSIWSYNTLNPNKVVKDTSKASYDTFNYVVSVDTISFYKSGRLLAKTQIKNNSLVIYQLLSSSPLFEAWNYFYLSGSSPISIPKTGLLGWYPFNGNANDESGNGNNGLVTGAQLTTDRNGVGNKAYYFNGQNNYIKVGNFNNADLYTSDFTLSAWYYNYDSSYTKAMMIIAKDSGCYGSQGQFRLDLGEGNAPNYPKNIGMTADGFGQMAISGSILKNGWNHILVVKKGSNSYMYYNGVLASTTKYNPGSTISTNPINYNCYFGTRTCRFTCNPSGYDGLFYGKLDDIGIWNRALDSNEVLSVYNYSANSTLPLHLTNFTATYQNKQSALRWSSTNETNTANFVVERSSNGSSFSQVGAVTANGSGNNSYGFTDANTTEANTLYYRLKMIDKDGSFTYSQTVQVVIPTNSNVQGISLAPNPANNSTTVYFKQGISVGTVYVYNSLGVKVLAQELGGAVRNSFVLPTAALEAGTYIVNVKTAVGTYTSKLQIVR